MTRCADVQGASEEEDDHIDPADDFDDEDGHIKHINALQEEGDTLKKDLKRHYHKLKKMATGTIGLNYHSA